MTRINKTKAGLSLLALSGALVMTLGQCFSPDLPVCSYQCASDEPACPDDYECRTDGYCHLKGSTEACPYSMDLGPDAAQARPDLSTTADLTPADAQSSSDAKPD